jgi:hypothetical protein
MPDRFDHPELVEFLHSRWQTVIYIVDRFGTDRWFKASADSHYTEGDGLYFAEVDREGNEIR